MPSNQVGRIYVETMKDLANSRAFKILNEDSSVRAEVRKKAMADCCSLLCKFFPNKVTGLSKIRKHSKNYERQLFTFSFPSFGNLNIRILVCFSTL